MGFVELISFGDLTYLTAFYAKLYSDPIVNNKFMNNIRDMRNAAAHSNCLINKLFETLKPEQQVDSTIANYVKAIPGISSNARTHNLRYRVVYSFITLLYVYDTVVPDGKSKSKRHAEIKDLFNDRMQRNKEYFSSYNKISGVYQFVKKAVDTLPS